ncbi:hypothetical protein CFP65_4360 [Kitasatospora sp. MMS16-BH015]|uniref:hypothetical protein n=1 Tax=Kitasatospora sp. MMS16-BH015 TaxID=2018025 RepID=UPI000CA3815F|nr:hypothetical protein [Kitasatospora sp. MMS16-BH015]AUG79110.1 hypothetical protein CFP65_4360 [Kitasatospora sp. MMS16-BH015]
MTLALYVLDVPEFVPLVRAAEAARMTSRRIGDYVELSTAADEVTISRAGTGIRTAVWHAALTGGLDARIGSFDSETLHLVKEGQ